MNEHIDPTCLVAGRICQLGAVLFLRDIATIVASRSPALRSAAKLAKMSAPVLVAITMSSVRKE